MKKWFLIQTRVFGASRQIELGLEIVEKILQDIIILAHTTITKNYHEYNISIKNKIVKV